MLPRNHRRSPLLTRNGSPGCLAWSLPMSSFSFVAIVQQQQQYRYDRCQVSGAWCAVRIFGDGFRAFCIIYIGKARDSIARMGCNPVTYYNIPGVHLFAAVLFLHMQHVLDGWQKSYSVGCNVHLLLCCCALLLVLLCTTSNY